MIECVTYRLAVHTTADDPSRYRDAEEVEEWRRREPLSRFQTYLKQKDLLSDGDIEAVEDEVKKEIQDAVDRAEKRMDELAGEELSMFDHIYAEVPPYLREQRDELARELQAKEGNDA